MRMSALPPRMQAHDLMAADKRRKWQHDVDRRTTYSFRPKTHDIPDFDALHKKDELEMFSRTLNKWKSREKYKLSSLWNKLTK